MKMWLFFLLVFVMILLAVNVNAGTQNNIYYNSTFISCMDTINATEDCSQYGYAGTVTGTAPVHITINPFISTGSGDVRTPVDWYYYDGVHLPTMGNFSCFGWGNLTGDGGVETMLSRGDGGDNAGEFRLYYDDINQNLSIMIRPDITKVVASFSNDDVKNTSFHHIGFTVNTSGTTYIYLYLNSNISAEASVSGSMTDSATAIGVGARQSDGGIRWEGWLDEVFCTNFTLNQDDIDWLYNNGIGRKLQSEEFVVPVINTTFNISVTNIEINDIINFTGNITDNRGLSTANITYNMSGILTKINFTLSGTSAQVSNATKITTSVNNVINFTMYATDSNNNVNQNSTLITVVDLTSPTVDSTSINVTPNINKDISISANIIDENSISSVFMAHNITGTMENKTSINLTTTQTELNYSVNITNTLSKGNIVQIIFTFNDTSGNEGQAFLNYTVNDTISPALINCSLEYSTLTDASGNTNNFTCLIEDIDSNIQSIAFNLWSPTINASKTMSTNGTGSYLEAHYEIFKSAEALTQGSYSITNISYSDDAVPSNTGVNYTTYLNFTVTSAPTGDGGGGGGGTQVIVKENITEVISGQCNFNGICEAYLGEDFTNCNVNIGGDCEFTWEQVNPVCLFRKVEGVPCIYRTGLFVRLMIIGVVLSIIVIYSDTSQGIKIRKYLKERFNIKLIKEG